MRKILSLLETLALSTTASTSIIACGGNNHTSFKEKTNLDIVNNKTFWFNVNTSNFYRDLDSIIPGSVCIFQSLRLKDGYKIKYYSDKQGIVEITNNNQNAGNFYFTIKAANDDPNWQGETKKLHMFLLKHSLYYVEQSNFPINFEKKFDNTIKYADLNSYIIDNCSEFKNMLLKDGYEIKYYSNEQGTVEITNNNQNAGDVYFTIKAANDDPNWRQETTKLKLKLT